MKKKLLLPLLLIFSIILGQKNTSLPLPSDTLKVLECLKLSKRNKKNNPEKAKEYSLEALNLSKKNNWEKGLQLSYSQYGDLLFTTNFKQALEYKLKALEIAKKRKEDGNIANYYNSIGTRFSDRGEHVTALEFFHKGLNYSKKNDSSEVRILINISILYLGQEDIPQSLAYYNKSLSVAEKIAKEKNNSTFLAKCWTIYGLICKYQEQYEIAETYYLKSLKLYKDDKNIFEQASLLMNLGDINQNPKTRLDYYIRSKKKWEEYEPENFLAISNLISIAELYIELASNDSLKRASLVKKSNKELYKEAEDYLKQSIQISKKTDTKENLIVAYSLFSTLKEDKKEYKEALLYLKKYDSLNTYLFSQDNKNTLAKIESEKEIALRDKQIEINKITLDAKEKQKYFYLMGLLALAIIISLLLRQGYIGRKNNAKLLQLNQELTEANQTKARFLGILNHDLRSPVASLISFLHLKKEAPEVLDETQIALYEDKTITAAENLLHKMEELLMWSKDQMHNFNPNFKPTNLNSLFESINSYFDYDKNSSLSFISPPDLSLTTDENYLKTIIRNLTANSIKSAKTQAIIEWRAMEKDNTIILSLKDNAGGITPDIIEEFYHESNNLNTKNGLGLQIIRDLSKAINCKIEIETEKEKGTTFRLIFNK